MTTAALHSSSQAAEQTGRVCAVANHNSAAQVTQSLGMRMCIMSVYCVCVLCLCMVYAFVHVHAHVHVYVYVYVYV